MIRLNVPLQSSRGILVYGEIIQTHTIRESNCTVIKLPRNGNFEAKIKLAKYNSVYRSYQEQLKRWKHLMIFYTDHPFVD